MLTRFARALKARQSGPSPRERTWLFVPYDQLSDQMGLLAERDPRELGVVLVENPGKAALRPYHQQKLALVIANLRQFALEQAGRGVAVRHVVAHTTYRQALTEVVAELGPLLVQEPAERELREDLAPLLSEGKLLARPHQGWLTTPDQFRAAAPNGPPWRMDAFYRLVRRETGILMTQGKPVGGQFSFDPENRLPWKGEPRPPEPPRFAPDEITREVQELIERHFAHHPGEVDLESLPSTAADAKALWNWALRHCLPHFGPFEDAMTTHSSGLFHSRISPLLNLHRLLPRQVVADVAATDLPLASQEGFIRQVLGWREFVRHVHRETDGFRLLPSGRVPIAEGPGDGGYARWAGRKWAAFKGDPIDAAGALPSALEAARPLPPAFWGEASGLHCLDQVVAGVWREGWSHHITRLMVLSNIASLLDVSPRELTDWFWVAYVDAYDWVVEPNVLGMGTFGAGDVMTTKPYIAGAAYIHRMSNYCEGCRFDPKKDCPLTPMYWAFLERHEQRLAGNQRLKVTLAAMRKRAPGKKTRDAKVFEVVSKALLERRILTPEDLPGDAE